MLFLCDESTRYKIKVIGAISLSEPSFVKFEHYALTQRVKYKVFGEIKWQKIGSVGKYFDFYLDIVKKLFSFQDVRFHSSSYLGNQYRASYVLIRSIIWKLQNARVPTNISVLYDKSNSSEIEIMRNLLRKDSRVKRHIDLCEEIKSETFVTLAVADILSGCTGFILNEVAQNNDTESNKTKSSFIKALISEVNEEVPFGISISKLWDYCSENKFQHHSLHEGKTENTKE